MKPSPAATTSTTGPVALRLASPVATICLQDTENRNRITDALHAGLLLALRDAGADPGVRAVVVEGLPDSFCAGAPVDRMLAGAEQRTRRLWELVEALLRCPVPVVAAAQGHALGGGLLLALYCDGAVFSARSRYAANFLIYGFTPILGATHLLPVRFGEALGTEMLYTGRGVTGRELAERGAGITVAEHDEVVARAHRVAARMAQAPRECLVRLKAQLSERTLTLAQAALAREIPDHEATIGAAEARGRIRDLHGQRLSERQG